MTARQAGISWLGSLGWLSSGRVTRLTISSPTEIANLKLWLLADDLTGNDGDEITTWTSKEGNNYSFTGAATKRPLLKKASNGINNHNTALFDGSNDILVYTAANAISTSQTGTLFVVYRLTNPFKDEQALFASYDEGGAATTGLMFAGYFNSTNKKLRIWQRNAGDTVDDMRGSTTLAVSTPYFVVFYSDGSDYFMRLNGTQQTITIGTGANSGDWLGDCALRDSATVGGTKYNAEATWLKGDVAEIILYDALLTDEQIQAVEEYLNNRYLINP